MLPAKMCSRVSMWVQHWFYRKLWNSLAIGLTFLVFFGFSATTSLAQEASDSKGHCPALLQHSMEVLHSDERRDLCEAYRGKVLLVVNTASRCGYTGQLEGLEALYQEFKQQGLVVLGFSSNDFRQELKDEAEVASYCKMNFGVSFPMFSTSSVKGDNANSVYKELISQTGKEPGWNFFKYLVDRDGNVVEYYPSRTKPSSEKLRSAIQQQLSRPSSEHAQLAL